MDQRLAVTLQVVYIWTWPDVPYIFYNPLFYLSFALTFSPLPLRSWRMIAIFDTTFVRESHLVDADASQEVVWGGTDETYRRRWLRCEGFPVDEF